jgi:ZipA, C-terminal FtsZ-binding domain
MPELRWTLLILGALFIGGLALWEWRRQRHARGPDSTAPGPFGPHGAQGAREGGERISPTFDDGIASSFDAPPAQSRGVFREPTLTFPEVTIDVPADSRDRFADPPVVELDDESLDRLKVEAGEAVDEFSEPSAQEIDPTPVPPAEPMIPRLSPAPTAPTLTAAADPNAALRAQRGGARPGESPASREARDIGDRPARSGEEFAAGHDFADDEFADDESAGQASGERFGARDPHDVPTTRFEASSDAEAFNSEVFGSSGSDAEVSGPAEGVLGPARVSASAAPPIPDSLEPVEPIVDWPDEDVRKIVALRLVSGLGERFAGRAVRQALAAEGFVLGKFDIFHKPGPDARAVLTAASLTKPGTFSLATMDAQRFGGLSLFAVLPGPLSPLATFDELMTTARALNDRLRGALQDERGEPLTPVRTASIRESLTASATAAAPVVGPAAAPPVVGSPASTTPS